MITIFHSEFASNMEIIACKDLQNDLKSYHQIEAQIVNLADEYSIALSQLKDQISEKIIVGTIYNNSLIHKLSEERKIQLAKDYPGNRGSFISLVSIEGIQDPQNILILGGSDPQGTQYAVYDFCKNELEIDPNAYWTGYIPKPNPSFSVKHVQNRIILPPAVPILGYFDNDNDELANLTQPYLEFSLEQWQELIKTLVRHKYNAIDIHDHLGRAEFYRWPFYQQLRPDYEPNTELLNQIIDYAHDRGVLIQVSFYLGWKFKVISDKASLDWAKYKKEWLDTWKYYLEKTPIGKCDIFLNRPRDQRWDRKYRGKGQNKDPVTVFNEVFPAMVKVIKEHNPNANIIADLYSEGRGVFNDGFRPQPKEDYIMAWPDNGFGDFDYMPKEQDGYKFGIYMHAGFFLNHVVMDPYPEKLAKAMKPALLDHKMTAYCLVNGQTFRHFLLNLETCTAICADPSGFDVDQFSDNWIKRYFGSDYCAEIKKIFHYLTDAQTNRFGYISLMINIKFIAKIALIRHKRAWIPKFLFNITQKLPFTSQIIKKLAFNVQILTEAAQICEKISAQVPDQAHFFHDHIQLPVQLLLQLNQVGYCLQQSLFQNNHKEFYNQAVNWAKLHHETRLKGDRNQKWHNWYHPDVRRPNGGYFNIEVLQNRNEIVIYKNR